MRYVILALNSDNRAVTIGRAGGEPFDDQASAMREMVKLTAKNGDGVRYVVLPIIATREMRKLNAQ